jgi:hypothetical protein
MVHIKILEPYNYLRLEGGVKMEEERKFHGMRVVSATETLKSTDVIELKSNEEVVVRHCNENGDPEDD